MRIINIDWLEVYCIEPKDEPHDAEFFKAKGLEVKERTYGTPIYKEMFAICQNGEPWIEIRRNPYSIKSEGGIMADCSCHLRLCNEACYHDNPIDELRSFILAFDYLYKSIARIDICLDFNVFDNGWTPQRFVNAYMRSNISKVNQTNVSCHGSDSWGGRLFNSLKWGATTSPISTKLYNKTMELQQGEDKSYIKQWWQCGGDFVGASINPEETSGLDMSQDVWRLEFSIKAQAQARKRSNGKKESFTLHLFDYDTKEKLWQRFCELYQMYFDFRKKEYVYNEKKNTRTLKRKYDCKRIDLFNFADRCVKYKPARKPRLKKRPDRIYKIMMNRIKDMLSKPNIEREYKEAFRTLLGFLSYKCNYEVLNFRIEEEDELLKLEAYRNRISDYEKSMAEMRKENHEKSLLYFLMQKYNIVPQPEGCPF